MEQQVPTKTCPKMECELSVLMGDDKKKAGDATPAESNAEKEEAVQEEAADAGFLASIGEGVAAAGAGEELDEQIRLAFRYCFGRLLRADELKNGRELVRHHGLAQFCRVLFNTNEFLFMP